MPHNIKVKTMLTIIPQDETSQILELNELAMSNHPVIASTARISKDLIPITTKVLRRELLRCEGDAIIAFSNFIQGIVMNTFILPMTEGDVKKSQLYMEELKGLFLNHFDKTIEMIPEALNSKEP